ncbi:hypothetical protein HRbin37_02027 [bacterium HR37]|nr:hypothetical protein HRbin37_02027 [bacterium HR37]
MKRLFTFGLITLGLILGTVGSFAKTKANPVQELKGEVVHIKDGLFTVKDETGKSHILKAADPKMLEGIKEGDKVEVKIEERKVTSIRKVQSDTDTMHEESHPEPHTQGVQ